MYAVIRTKLEDKGKLVRAYISMGEWETQEEAQDAIDTKASKRDLEQYEFTIVPTELIYPKK